MKTEHFDVLKQLLKINKKTSVNIEQSYIVFKVTTGIYIKLNRFEKDSKAKLYLQQGETYRIIYLSYKILKIVEENKKIFIEISNEYKKYSEIDFRNKILNEVKKSLMEV